ncbi:DUF881 domain-containing protein [Kineococcus radiotolerans]|uniref:Membrane associated protein n=1 Tax=Kineococcus radiotolerans (strain ATCC BAA-149 / DSM 14245 / SRS30216) TaxID=266940 RepID=A6WCM5_KINRD|nr:DUF881 domain-containing protein [Kineococcus radiotolerans]ABS04564.1 protein of unknown function DUF881 [Kineococcus radiotolerans SRS30216 = ATCC BAA-149]
MTRGPGPAGREPAGRDPAASTALLTEVMTRPLDPGYAAAARRRAESGAPRSRAGRGGTWLALLAIGALLAVAGARAAAAEPAADRGRQALLQRIDDATTRSDRLTAQVAQAQAGNAELAAALGGAPAASADARAEGLAVAAAATAVTGPGLQVVLDDAPEDGSAGSDGVTTSGRVVDRDVQIVVNGLWQNGAEAVAVNGQRLSSLSSIRAAGEAVLVDHRPLTPPYTISAIGDPAALETGLATSVAGRYLQVLRDNYDIPAEVTTRSAQDALTLPAAPRLDLRLARADAQ